MRGKWTTLIMGGTVAVSLNIPAFSQAPAAGNGQNVGERKEARGEHLEKKGNRVEKKGEKQEKVGGS